MRKSKPAPKRDAIVQAMAEHPGATATTIALQLNCSPFYVSRVQTKLNQPPPAKPRFEEPAPIVKSDSERFQNLISSARSLLQQAAAMCPPEHQAAMLARLAPSSPPPQPIALEPAPQPETEVVL